MNPQDHAQPAVDSEISDEEANEEFDLPFAASQPRASAAHATPAPTSRPAPAPASSADETTPSVKTAVGKAADILREMRGER